MKQLSEYVKKHSNLIKEAHDYIWSNPETGYREWKTSKYLEERFEKLGYELVRAGNIPGFYTIIDTGKPGPEILVLGELDSLICSEHPEANPITGAVHCCGHSMQSSALLGLAAALKEPGVLEAWTGRIRLCAVPAEELLEIEYRTQLMKEGTICYMGGKTEFLYRGLFDGVDLAMMVHSTVEPWATVTPQWVGFFFKRVTYKGVSAHAGGAPWDGCNALYAANLGLQAINSIRETFRENDLIRVHPIITQGGGAVNAIPDNVTLESYVRGISLKAIEKVNSQVNRALCGAALSLGANIEIEDIPGYAPFVNSPDLIQVVAEAMTALPDIEFKKYDHLSTISTDMGDLSCLMPTIQPCLPGAVGSLHGVDFCFPDSEKTCVNSAILQLHMLDILLKNEAKRAKEIAKSYVPQFTTKEKYFAYINQFKTNGLRIEYMDDQAIVKL